MRAVFIGTTQFEKHITIRIKFGDFSKKITLKNNNQPYSEWIYQEKEQEKEELRKLFDSLMNTPITEEELSDAEKEEKRLEEIHRNMSQEQLEEAHSIMNQERELNNFKKFIIFSPENSTLRNFEKEAEIKPLGINGEGLFELLFVMQYKAKESEQDREELKDIKESLELFGWYEGINIPDDYRRLDKSITIKDRYLELPFDQRSANEGFLLVLFYITLVVSNYTPKIFAIDNIDTSLNPKLCTKLIKELARLAKKYDKQLFVTSHNPAILDGIDLSDDEQRLFVVSRNKQGHTRCKRIEAKDAPVSSVRDRLSKLFDDNKTYTKEEILNAFDNSEEALQLSYALLRGYLGGLPKNF
ncbi:MAG TPA: chromosome segregation protein SMC [Flavobacterium sp.]|nr:chromosome segregation protein SMC [Flavobacterium sp.]